MAAPFTFSKAVLQFALFRKAYQHGNTCSNCLSFASSRFRMASNDSKGLVLGVYEPQEEGSSFILTSSAQKFDESCGGKLIPQLKTAGRKLKCGKSRLLFGLDDTYTSVAIANLGKQDVGFDSSEQLDQSKENVRTAVAGGLLQLRDCGESEVIVDPCGDAEAAAEGSYLALYSYDELRSEKSRKPKVDISCFTQDNAVLDNWTRGMTLAESQNFARYLKDSPSNYMTPSKFCHHVQSAFSSLPKCEVTVRDKSWAESMNMGSFLSVAKGSVEPPLFLEIDYKGGVENDSPVALVGKGITFDTGGISIKPSSNMDKMRADMGGAACVVGAIQGAIKLGLPINIKGFIPLCENMPSGTATNPGDVVTAMNGKTIQILVLDALSLVTVLDVEERLEWSNDFEGYTKQVDNTDAEGRLILADALCYAETFKPKLIVDLATLTGAIMVALGGAATGVFTNSQVIWDLMSQAGEVTGDRVWRMPLFKYYNKQIVDADLADLNNVGKKSRYGGSCTAAAFLQEFVTTDKWMHMDIANVMENQNDVPYMGKGMSGRPTRTLIKFLENTSKIKI